MKQALHDYAEHFVQQIADTYHQLVDEQCAHKHPLTLQDICEAIESATSVVETAVKRALQPTAMQPQAHDALLERAAHAFADQIHTRFGHAMNHHATIAVGDAIASHAQRVYREYKRQCNLEAADRLRPKLELVSKGHLNDLLKEYADDFAQQIADVYPQLVDEECGGHHPLTDYDVSQAIELASDAVDKAVKSALHRSASTIMMHPQTRARDALERAAHAFAEHIHKIYTCLDISDDASTQRAAMERQATDKVGDAVAFHAQRVWNEHARRSSKEAAERFRQRGESAARAQRRDYFEQYRVEAPGKGPLAWWR
jgi:uncharacterized protein with PIN domain